MDAEVLLHVDASGDVTSVTRKVGGEPVRYDIVQEVVNPNVLHASVVTYGLHKELPPELKVALNACIVDGGAVKVAPLPNCYHDGRGARGLVNVLRAKSKPSESGWPLDLRYATGVTLVEIERILPNQTYASIELFKSPEFGRRMQAAVRELHEEAGSPPGLVSPGHPLLESFRALTPTGSTEDPLLRTYRFNFLNTWRPRLREGDFIQIYYSTWDTVNAHTRAICGHGPQDVHFYFALCWHFPEEMAEQLLQLARLNPENQTWGQLAARKEFERAVEISTKAREDILTRFMSRVALEPKRSVKQRFVHTTTDILVPGLVSKLPGKPKPTSCVGFYSNSAPTHLSGGGVLSITENSPNEPAFWWHGRHTPENPGGEPWEMEKVFHAMPVMGPTLKFGKKTIGLLGGLGGPDGGVKLMPIC